MTTKLIDVRAPGPDDEGAEIVFVRRNADGVGEHFVKASYCDGSYQQWGATRDVLGDNVEAATLWAAGLREVHALIETDD